MNSVRIVNKAGRPVFVGSSTKANEMINGEDGYTIQPATDGNERWWQWFLPNVTAKAVVAQAAVHQTFTLEAVCDLMGESVGSWQGYFNACETKGLSNRTWDPVLWKAINAAKSRIVRKLQAIG